MEKVFAVLVILSITAYFSACEMQSQTSAESLTADSIIASDAAESPSEASSASSGDTASGKSHILVAFFSQAGEQYGVGVVEKGNTQIVAEMIAHETNACFIA